MTQYVYYKEDLTQEREEDPEQNVVVVHRMSCNADYELSFGVNRKEANEPNSGFNDVLFNSLKALKADVKENFPDAFEKLTYEIVE